MKINYLRVSVTDRCNFRCRYCVPEGTKEFIPHSEILRYEEIAEIVGIFYEFGVNSVRLTGGEPLVRRGLENLILQIKERGIGEVSLTTNGFLLSEKAKLLKSCGLDRVNISIDTLDPEKFAYITGTKNKGALSKVIEGLETSLEAGLTPVKVNTVLIRGFNDSEVEDFIRFSENYEVEVRFIELMPVGGEFFTKENFIPASEIKRFIEERFGKLIPVKTRKKGPAKSFRIEGTQAVVGFISSVSEHFCNSCNRLRLTSDGKLRLCLMKDREIDLKSILRSPVYSRELLKKVILEALVEKRSVNGIEALRSLGCHRKMFTIGG
ncbi:GTP 3',8-cyclase MoaA [Phorcysia thermohydrogeniphila]|uniref:GTP 3',8-cyclase n=1 Tax=Phorcysia thermohydrogeniphila TaxID=936138 RepID=A0A4R1GE96_9BACT|nr:GTP 3',8-cyclase MoaA [Phorcysia thermohydrogeniphila]TCK06248.1 cyclic pyranopterin phosphate synthase [Phorcysia thermohydrogeniphila]